MYLLGKRHAPDRRNRPVPLGRQVSRKVRGRLTLVPLMDHLDAVEAQSICMFRKLLRV
jgi:hypothetical protein